MLYSSQKIALRVAYEREMVAALPAPECADWLEYVRVPSFLPPFLPSFLPSASVRGLFWDLPCNLLADSGLPSDSGPLRMRLGNGLSRSVLKTLRT